MRVVSGVARIPLLDLLINTHQVEQFYDHHHSFPLNMPKATAQKTARKNSSPCDSCSRARRRCDGVAPHGACSYCRKKNESCEYTKYNKKVASGGLCIKHYIPKGGEATLLDPAAIPSIGDVQPGQSPTPAFLVAEIECQSNAQVGIATMERYSAPPTPTLLANEDQGPSYQMSHSQLISEVMERLLRHQDFISHTTTTISHLIEEIFRDLSPHFTSTSGIGSKNSDAQHPVQAAYRPDISRDLIDDVKNVSVQFSKMHISELSKGLSLDCSKRKPLTPDGKMIAEAHSL
ncbi:hypothetical protein SCHPADRAFT_661267 [Schizopora paradoxa]|uniref:Zn(2)-C6 fungal-type domain-containing protein n=1 Tax=Schizopora paradoxa TaxID=27342 RepID=A0A0H2R5V1_9AGAM|nr:hypothetical protein SCHPADRAFT_661267 [Schizopora paradoxa]